MRGVKRAACLWHMLAVLGLLLLSACGSPEDRATKAMARFDEYYAEHDLFNARVQIRNAIHELDDIPEYWNKLGRIELDLNNVQNAYSAYRRVLELDPDNREGTQAMAELSYSGGSPDESLKYANKILLTEPRNLRMLLVKGLVALDRTEYDDAHATALKMRGISAGDEGGVILLARTEYAMGDPGAAIATVEDSIRQNGVSMQKLVMLIDFYNSRNDFHNLNHSYARLFRLDPDNRSLRLNYAQALYENGLPDRALIVIERLQQRYPGDPALQRQIVDLWKKVGSAAIDLDGVRRFAQAGNAQMKMALAQLAIDQHRYAEAEQVVAPFLGSGKITPENVQANVLHASAVSGLGRNAQARALVDRILAFDSTNSQALLLRTQIETDRRDLPAALNDVQTLTRDNPSLAAGWIAFARIYTLRKDFALADGIYGRAIGSLPDDLEILADYTAYLADTGRRDLALDVADRFTRRNPRLLDGWKARADLCLKLGDKACVQKVRDSVGPLRGGDALRATLGAVAAGGRQPPSPVRS